MKGLRKIPPFERSETIKVNVPARELRNIHGVPAKVWVKWSAQGKELFNYLYSFGTTNPDGVFAVYKFNYGPDKDSIIHAAAWNMAWEAASKISKS